MYDKLSHLSPIMRTAARLGGLLLVVGLFWLMPGPAGAQSTAQLDLMIVVDHSTSMCCPPTRNDPNAERMRFARLFVSLLGVDQLGTDYRLGFVYFGTDANLIAPLSPVAQTADREALFNRIGLDQDAPNMIWTDIAQALRVARAELEQNGRPTAKKAVVLLTDGEPRLDGWQGSPNLDQLLDAYINELRAYIDGQWGDNIPLFTVAFSQEAFKEDPDYQVYKNLYEELAYLTGAPGDHGYQEARSADDLGQIYFNIISSLLGIEGLTLEPPVPVPVTKQFQIDSGLAQIIFVVLKDNPDIAVTVTDPSGNVIVCGPGGTPNVACGRSQREESIGITTPQPGIWTVSLTGQGFIRLEVVRFRPDDKYGFRLVSPTKPHPAGKPLEIIVTVEERGTSATVPVENAFVRVVYPSLVETAPLALGFIGDGQYAAILEDTREPGDYKLIFTGDVAGGPIETEGMINVRPVPWVRIERPTGGGHPLNQPVDVVGQLMWGDRPQEQFDASWALTASANLEGPDGRPRPARPLDPAADGTFSGQFDPPGVEGEYIVELSVMIETTGGEQITDVTRGRFGVGAAFNPAPPPTAVPTQAPAPTPAPAPTREPRETNPVAVAGGGFGGLLLVGLAAAGIYAYRRPKLSGDVNVEGASGGFYSLKGRKPATIGSGPRSTIRLDGEDIAAAHAEFRPRGNGVELASLVGEGGDYAAVLARGESERSFHVVPGTHDMRHGDLIKIGGNTLYYTNPALGGGFQAYDDLGGDDFHFDIDDE